MADDTFHCSIVTPERAVLDCEARSVVFPAWDGEIGVLRNRAPLLCRLGIGVLKAATDDGETVLFVDGGFAQMVAYAVDISINVVRVAMLFATNFWDMPIGLAVGEGLRLSPTIVYG